MLQRHALAMALGLCAPLAHGAAEANAPPIEVVVRAITRQVVQVITAQGLGSAVLVAADRAITSCHVLGDAAQAMVALGGEPRAVPVLARDAFHDLCVLGVPPQEGRTPALCRDSSLLVAGEDNWAVGFASGRLGFSRGKLVARYAFDGAHVLRTSAGFLPGASGGGLFDAQGRLVGVLTALRRSGGSTAYLATPCAWVQRALAGTGSTAPGPAPAPFWQLSGAAAPAFMQALALEAEGRWPELLLLARRWQAGAPDDDGAQAMEALARLHTGEAAAQLVQREDAGCAQHGGKRVVLQRAEAASGRRTLRVWVERWFMDRRTADRTRHDLGQEVELGCSRTASGDAQRWEIVGAEWRDR